MKFTKKRFTIFAIVVIASAIIAGGTVLIRGAYAIPILMYHSIDDNDHITKLSVSPKSFERQMEFLYKNRYNVVGLDKFVRYTQKKERIPPKTVVITFDDGYMNNYTYAYPVLKKYNLPAAMFVVADKIDIPGWLGRKEIRQMASSGLITIGSHTKAHAWLPSADNEALKHELEDSKKTLEDCLGKPVDFLCYPLGAYDDRVKKAAKEAGYIAAFTTNPSKHLNDNDIYAIRRVRISRTSDNLFVFWVKTSGWYIWLKKNKD